jgi:hypothetical protein
VTDPSASAGPFHVTVQFTTGGPAISGTWSDPDVAHQKYRNWVGSHGSRPGVTVTLWLQTPDGLVEIRTWTAEHGEVVHREDL